MYDEHRHTRAIFRMVEFLFGNEVVRVVTVQLSFLELRCFSCLRVVVHHSPRIEKGGEFIEDVVLLVIGGHRYARNLRHIELIFDDFALEIENGDFVFDVAKLFYHQQLSFRKSCRLENHQLLFRNDGGPLVWGRVLDVKAHHLVAWGFIICFEVIHVPLVMNVRIPCLEVVDNLDDRLYRGIAVPALERSYVNGIHRIAALRHPNAQVLSIICHLSIHEPFGISRSHDHHIVRLRSSNLMIIQPVVGKSLSLLSPFEVLVVFVLICLRGGIPRIEEPFVPQPRDVGKFHPAQFILDVLAGFDFTNLNGRPVRS
mmetsp:Transcript_2630/g.5019  ORF Transcript_2630/g.5019 Transcript_2630/m.5019 type:complete len:314 (+) Transcript_2630:1105-2046(+)